MELFQQAPKDLWKTMVSYVGDLKDAERDRERAVYSFKRQERPDCPWLFLLLLVIVLVIWFSMRHVISTWPHHGVPVPVSRPHPIFPQQQVLLSLYQQFDLFSLVPRNTSDFVVFYLKQEVHNESSFSLTEQQKQHFHVYQFLSRPKPSSSLNETQVTTHLVLRENESYDHQVLPEAITGLSRIQVNGHCDSPVRVEHGNGDIFYLRDFHRTDKSPTDRGLRSFRILAPRGVTPGVHCNLTYNYAFYQYAGVDTALELLYNQENTSIIYTFNGEWVVIENAHQNSTLTLTHIAYYMQYLKDDHLVFFILIHLAILIVLLIPLLIWLYFWFLFYEQVYRPETLYYLKSPYCYVTSFFGMLKLELCNNVPDVYDQDDKEKKAK